MERRISVLAGGNTQALIHLGGPWRAWLVAVMLVSISSAAEARPKRRDARAAFDRGVTAYQKGNFEAAATALSKSYDLEHDVDTLFAWAQTERKLERCDKAIELYEKLLASNLPSANKSAVEQKLSECRVVVAQQKPVAAPAAVPPAAEPAVQPKAQPASRSPRVADSTDSAPEPPLRSDAGSTRRAWFKDPVALGLIGTGVLATGVGAGLVVSASSLANATPKNWDEAVDNSKTATSRGYIGQASMAVGGALVIGGVVWIVAHRGGTERAAVTGWVAPGGGGLAVGGPF